MWKPGSFMLLCFYGAASAQPGGVMNPVSINEFSVPNCFKGKAFSGAFHPDSLKANSVLKGTRIWRAIDLENQQNGVLFNGSNDCAEVGLFEIIKFGLLEKQLHAFSSDDFNEALTTHISRQELIKRLMLHDSSEVVVFDAQGNSQVQKNTTHRYLMGSDIKGYLMKEDWLVNSHSGKAEKRIIGLAPLVLDRSSGKVRALFWLYYAEWQELMGLFEARNFYSYQRISYRQVFEKRYFVSIISKESNVFERAVKSYRHGDEALMESERIKERLGNSEQDLFQY
jgi:gliding motility associated protien GldN